MGSYKNQQTQVDTIPNRCKPTSVKVTKSTKVYNKRAVSKYKLRTVRPSDNRIVQQHPYTLEKYFCSQNDVEQRKNPLKYTVQVRSKYHDITEPEHRKIITAQHVD